MIISKVDENTEYKLSKASNDNSAMSVPVARILYSAYANAKSVGEIVDGVIAFSEVAFDTTFSTPLGAKFVYIGITPKNFSENITMQKITEKHPTATYPVGNYKLINIEVDEISDLFLQDGKKSDIPIVTIMDDDGTTGFTDILKPLFDEYKYKGTLAIVPTWVGSNDSFMDLNTLKTIFASGHDFVSHSYTHSNSIWYSNGIKTTNRTDRKNECEASRDWFIDNGFVMPQAIAYPSGGYSTMQKRIIEDDVKQYFDYGFTTESGVMNESPLHSLMLKRTIISKNNNFDYYKRLIDDCISKNGWLILFCHSGNSAEVDTSFLTLIFDYLKYTKVAVLRFTDALSIKRNICSIGSWYKDGSLYIGRDGAVKNANP